MILDETFDLQPADSRAAELALVQDREQQRGDERDRGVPQIDGAHFAAGHMQRQPLFDRCQQRLERRLQIARSDPAVVQPLDETDDVGADAVHVGEAECGAAEQAPNRTGERLVRHRDQRPEPRRLASLPVEEGLQHAVTVLEVVTQGRDADAGSRGELAEARPALREIGQAGADPLEQLLSFRVVVAVATA